MVETKTKGIKALGKILNNPEERRKAESLDLYVHSIIPFESFAFFGLVNDLAPQIIRDTLINTF